MKHSIFITSSYTEHVIIGLTLTASSSSLKAIILTSCHISIATNAFNFIATAQGIVSNYSKCSIISCQRC